MPPLPDVLPDDPAALKAIILAQREEVAHARASALAFEALVQALRIQIAKLRRQRFGSSSERIGRELEQLQLTLEDVEVAIAANDDQRSPKEKDVLKETFASVKLPAEIEVYEGAAHGWCPPDSGVYNEPQAEKAWSRLLALYGKALA